jgi:hypothetical protein
MTGNQQCSKLAYCGVRSSKGDPTPAWDKANDSQSIRWESSGFTVPRQDRDCTVRGKESDWLIEDREGRYPKGMSA